MDKQEGILRLREEDSGYRHYILHDDGAEDDIHCGGSLEVLLGEWVEEGRSEALCPTTWLKGRYEADLCSDKPVAYLYFGLTYPLGTDLVCKLPEGIKVRRPVRKEE